MKLDILAIWVHPDDIEICCSGTLLKHIDLWYKVGLCDLTQGELGTRWSWELRLLEAEEARKRLWALVRENCGMADGFFKWNQENLRKIIDVIRTYQPDIVLANALQDRHPDHGRAGKLIQDACFYAWLRKIESNLPARRPKAVYHYVQDRNFTPDFVVDITPYIKQKEVAIMAYSSQFHNPDLDETEPTTAISTPEFLESVRAKNRVYGRPIGATYAEAFTAGRYIGVNDLFDLV